MLSQKEARELKKIVNKEAPQLEVEVVPDPIQQENYHLKVTTRYVIAIRSLEEWHDRKRLLTEK